MIQISALYGGLLALLFIMLSYNVAARRKRLGVGAGDGEDRGLLKAIRIHSNFIEYVPFALILLAILELNNIEPALLHISGTALFFARIAHYRGLTKTLGASIERLFGVVVTWLVIILLALMNLYYYVMSNFLSA